MATARVVVFTSDATNLVSEPDANGRQTDIYAWQLETGRITRISVDSHGAQPSAGSSHSPRVSRDGAVVAFVSTARLASADTNTVADVYVRDVRHGITVLASGGVDSAHDGPSSSPAISADGRYVAFESLAALDPKDRNNDRDVYIFDVTARTTTLVSMTSKGQSANAASRRPALSDDGEVVAYESLASNLGSRPGMSTGRQRHESPSRRVRVRPCDAAAWRASAALRARNGGHRASRQPIDASGGTIVFSSAQPSDADDPTTDFDLFHAVIGKRSRERLRKARHVGLYLRHASALAAAARIAPPITMTLAPGSRLGAYEVLSALGAGGMGEVYRARDTRLNRDVAIKVLPAERLADEHRRRRFQQEARALSSLNHPHIVTIYEVESAGDRRLHRDGVRARQQPRSVDPLARLAE